MDQTPEPTFEDSLKEVMQTLPPVIRTYLTQGKYTAVAKTLMAKYDLRIDQGGVLEREIMLLLMGVEDPNEFVKALSEEAGLSQQVINGISQDVNEQIFTPLRAEEMKGGMAAGQPAPSAPRPAEAFGVGGAPVAAEQPQKYFHLENKIALPVRPAAAAPAPRPQASPAPLPRAPQSGGTLGDVVRSILPPQEPLESSALLEDHEEPHIEINKIPTPIAPIPPKPAAPQFVSARPSMPLGEGAPVNLPVATPPAAPLSDKEMVSAPPPAPAPMAAKPAAPAPVTSYAADPYREPIDEPLSEM